MCQCNIWGSDFTISEIAENLVCGQEKKWANEWESVTTLSQEVNSYVSSDNLNSFCEKWTIIANFVPDLWYP